MDFTKNELIKAARVISNCPKSRLPYVLKLYELGGLDIEDVEKYIDYVPHGKDRTEYRKELRKAKGKESWKETKDFTSLRLRLLYEDGKSIIKIAEKAGMCKSNLYLYIRGESKPNSGSEKLINNAINELYGTNEYIPEEYFWMSGDEV